MNWLKWFIGSTTDPKFAVVARRTGQNVAAVLAVWAMLLERAGQADERGDVSGFDCEAADVALGLDDGAACAIVDALSVKGLLDGRRIANWDKRQAQDESEAAKERKRLQREREKLTAERLSLEKARAQQATMSQDVTECHTRSHPCHDMSRHVTNVTPKKRIEEIRNINTSPPVESLVNQDRARSPERHTGGEGEASPFCQASCPESPLTSVDLSGPGMEFAELRDFYTREIRAEGPLDGFAEYKQLKAARDATGKSVFPGLSRLLDDLAARKNTGAWNPGYEIGLARYLKTHAWLAPIQARASPQQQAKSWLEREDEANYAAALENAARYEAEKAHKRSAQ